MQTGRTRGDPERAESLADRTRRVLRGGADLCHPDTPADERDDVGERPARVDADEDETPAARPSQDVVFGVVPPESVPVPVVLFVLLFDSPLDSDALLVPDLVSLESFLSRPLPDPARA